MSWLPGSASLIASQLLLAPAAQAAVAAPERAPPPGVELAVVGDFAGADALGPRVASWFDAQALRVRTTRTRELSQRVVFAASDGAGVRIWIVLTAPTVARLFFVVQEQPFGVPRFLVQDVELPSGLDELGLERLAQVAYLSALALWDGNVESSRREVEQELPAAPTTRPPAPSRARSAPPVAPPSDAWYFRGRFELDTRLHGPEGTFVGPLVGAGLVWPERGVRELSLAGDLGWLFVPSHVEREGVALELSAFSGGLSAAYSARLSARWWWCVQAGPALELVSYRVKSVENATLDGERRSGRVFRPLLRTGLGVRALAGPLAFALTATLGVPFVHAHYDLSDSALPSGRQELITPWPVLPGLTLGVLY